MKHYDIEASPFYFSRDCREWEGSRVAALNCFADGGTNAHVIVEGWEESRAASALRMPIPLPAAATGIGPGDGQRHSPPPATPAPGALKIKSNWWMKQASAAETARIP